MLEERHGRDISVDTIGASHDRQCQRKVVEAARQRAEAQEDADRSRHARREAEEPCRGDSTFGWLETVDTAEMCGQPDGTSKV